MPHMGCECGWCWMASLGTQLLAPTCGVGMAHLCIHSISLPAPLTQLPAPGHAVPSRCCPLGNPYGFIAGLPTGLELWASRTDRMPSCPSADCSQGLRLLISERGCPIEMVRCPTEILHAMCTFMLSMLF